jgi:hypothetical protein
MSNTDLSKIKSISDKIMQDVFDDKGIGVQAKRNLRESSLDLFPKWKSI